MKMRLREHSTELGYWLQRSANLFSRELRHRMQEAGVTSSEAALLRELHRVGQVSPTLLTVEMGMTKGAVSKVVDQLLKKGLVSRWIHEEDRRHQGLGLTRRGTALVAKLVAIAATHEDAFFGDLPAHARRELLTTLQGLATR